MKYVYLQFPGSSEWTDISQHIRKHSIKFTFQLMNDDYSSVIDTMSFSVKHDQSLTAQFMAVASQEKILCKVYDEEDTQVFTGYIAPQLHQQKGKTIGELALDVRDNSWRLDVPISDDIQLPSSIDDAGISLRLIYETLLQHAGYDSADIIDDGEASTITVRMVHLEKESGTYREYLDEILSQYGYVFTTNGEGKFSLYQWNQNTWVSSKTLEHGFSTVSPLQIYKSMNDYDGIQVFWPETTVFDDVKLYEANLPIGSDGIPSGVAIPPGGYYPEDGDVLDTYQKYQTDWLDTAYLYGEAKEQNKDIALISSDNHYCIITKDDGITYTESFESHKAQVLFHNPTGDILKIYTFEIRGRALFRSAERKTLCPDDAVNPEKTYGNHIFTVADAEFLASGLVKLLVYGDFSYQFTLYDEQLAIGDIVTLVQADPVINTKTLVLKKTWIEGKPGCSYTVRAVSEVGSLSAHTQSFHLTRSGKGEQGETGDTLYTWIRYADDASGSGMSADPTGKTYIGIAYNKTDPAPSSEPEDYEWSLYRGPAGEEGPRGAAAIGLGLKMNHSDFSTTNPGEIYIHGFDETGNAADVNGFLYHNDSKLTVLKRIVNPDAAVDGFLVLNITTGGALTGEVYAAKYNYLDDTFTIKDGSFSHEGEIVDDEVSGEVWIIIGRMKNSDSETTEDAYLYEKARTFRTLRDEIVAEILFGKKDITQDEYEALITNLGIQTFTRVAAESGFIEALITQDFFAQNAVIRNLLIGNGSDTSGFRFRARTYNDSGNYSPIIDVYYSGTKIFEIDPTTGDVTIGPYDSGGNGIKWNQSAGEFSIRGIITSGSKTASEKFEVLSDGSIKATDADIEGTVSAGSIQLSTVNAGNNVWWELESVLSTYVGADDEKTVTLLKATIPSSGEFRFNITFDTGNDVPYAEVRIYRNGTLVDDTMYYESSGGKVETVDVSGWNIGDMIRIDIWLNNTGFSGPADINLFEMCADKTLGSLEKAIFYASKQIDVNID